MHPVLPTTTPLVDSRGRAETTKSTKSYGAASANQNDRETDIRQQNRLLSTGSAQIENWARQASESMAKVNLRSTQQKG